MNARLPWVLTALLSAALLFSHLSHERRLDQMNEFLGESAITTQLSKDDKQPSQALSARVEALEGQIAKMKDRRRKRGGHHGQSALRDGTGQRSMSMAAAMATPAERSGGEQVLEVLESEDPEVRERLRDVIDDELQSRREQRRAERREQKKANAEKMVQGLISEYGISDSQAGSLRELLSDEHDQIRELFELARQDHSWGEARDKAQDLREENNEDVSELLDEDAYKAWQEQRDAEIARHYGRKRN
jgi:hypothetical protein